MDDDEVVGGVIGPLGVDLGASEGGSADRAGRDRLTRIYAALARYSLEERNHWPDALPPNPVVLIRPDSAEWFECLARGVDAGDFPALLGAEFLTLTEALDVRSRIVEFMSSSRPILVRGFGGRRLGAVEMCADARWTLGPLGPEGLARMLSEWSSDGRAPIELIPDHLRPEIRPHHWALALRGGHPRAADIARLLVSMLNADARAERRRVGPSPRDDDADDQRRERLARELLAPPAKPQPPAEPALTLADCPGLGAEADEWAADLVRDLTDYRAGKLAWADVDRGILLAGPPGTGKTRFAKCLAGSAGVPIVATSAAQWISSGSGHLGTYVQAMRKAAEEAAAKAPSILFIDEIDACGDRRAGGNNAAWTSAAVAALLEILDGHARREGVVVVAATNMSDDVDPALKRPGRLDRTVEIHAPDEAGLAAILLVHLSTLLPDADLSPVAARAKAAGGTGSHVERWVREARRKARRARREMTVDDLLSVIPEGEPPAPRIGFAVG